MSDYTLGLICLPFFFAGGYFFLKWLERIADKYGPYRDEWEKKQEHRENCCCCERKGPSEIGDFTSSKMTFYD
ncbi:hypothetical protein [Geoalkalibacter halelectricus]|uniref:Uncharacterized protein n=1 Tax=Geoalkalibacter halelectricus TaxID=2847045 RepID=A0ABY5ZPF5_9BACT|nr:hypothetical protein [Geoalkalibacter halelectricus]MDO3380136.1 hypothetical protein [Geoalkalibacter halelectricus]UWZ79765.1 hypothetical protein L9S41_19105 [Geoalkalibacter halelectricus]